jgi:hypothetical protein
MRLSVHPSRARRGHVGKERDHIQDVPERKSSDNDSDKIK